MALSEEDIEELEYEHPRLRGMDAKTRQAFEYFLYNKHKKITSVFEKDEMKEELDSFFQVYQGLHGSIENWVKNEMQNGNLKIVNNSAAQYAKDLRSAGGINEYAGHIFLS